MSKEWILIDLIRNGKNVILSNKEKQIYSLSKLITNYKVYFLYATKNDYYSTPISLLLYSLLRFLNSCLNLFFS